MTKLRSLDTTTTIDPLILFSSCQNCLGNSHGTCRLLILPYLDEGASLVPFTAEEKHKIFTEEELENEEFDPLKMVLPNSSTSIRIAYSHDGTIDEGSWGTIHKFRWKNATFFPDLTTYKPPIPSTGEKVSGYLDRINRDYLGKFTEMVRSVLDLKYGLLPSLPKQFRYEIVSTKKEFMNAPPTLSLTYMDQDLGSYKSVNDLKKQNKKIWGDKRIDKAELYSYREKKNPYGSNNDHEDGYEYSHKKHFYIPSVSPSKIDGIYPEEYTCTPRKVRSKRRLKTGKSPRSSHGTGSQTVQDCDKSVVLSDLAVLEL